MSAIGPVAYVEAEFFGGVGDQSAVAWSGGVLAFGPIHAPDAINRVLRLLGVRADEAHDEFDTVGLGRHRDTAGWIPGKYAMTDAELLSEFSIRIYMPPLSEIRESGRIRDLSNPIAVAMLVVDYETEVTMNGITDFIGNNTGIYADETVAALARIGCSDQSRQLKRILEIAAAAGMTHDTIRQDRSCMPAYSITSFAELHGKKWDAAGAEIDKLNRSIDYSVIMQHAERFVAEHRSEFIAALGP